jgi:predicted nucleotide-binding protein (sugar kinase/HSP70/actin superfamily)
LRIGIPRALGAYQYYPLWKTFLNELGQTVLLSPPTNRKILDLGVASSADDACLPVKIFHGHAAALDGAADAILIQQVMSVQKKEYSCPLVCGLPEMIRFSLPLQTGTLPVVMNAYRKLSDLYRGFEELGLRFTKDRGQVKWAFVTAWEAYSEHVRLMRQGYDPGEMLDGRFEKRGESGGPLIGLLSHPYMLYDGFTGKTVFSYLKDSGFSAVTPEMLPEAEIEAKAAELPKKMFWTPGKKLYGSTGVMAELPVSGVIYLSSFVCGIDSIIADLSERLVRKNGIPFMLLTLDEHTGEAGVKTRLEAFCDLLKRRFSDGRLLPPYGQYLHSAEGGVR